MCSAGGAWSSTNDLAKIGRSILQSSSILADNVRQEWLRRVVHTSNTNAAVGKPWEVFRMNVPVEPDSNATRLVDLYTKNGGYGPYNAELILSPDHEIGAIVLVASLTDPNAGAGPLWTLNEMAADIWVPAAEAAARDAAAANIAGTFISQDGLNSSIVLAIVSDRKGIQISELVYNGTNFLADMLPAFGSVGGSLQYMDLRDGDSNGTQLAFRAVWQQAKLQGNPGVFKQDCLASWAEVDTVKYGDVGSDEFVVTVDESGRAFSVEMPFLRTTFLRQ